MKIACLVTNDLSQDQRMDRICRSLCKAGHDVTLVGRLKPDSLPLADRPYRQIRLPVRRQSGKGFYAEYNWQLWRWLLTNDGWEAVNAVDLDTLLPAWLYCRHRPAKLVYDAHEYFSETPEVVHRPLIKKVWELLASRLIPQADLCYTVGPELGKIFTERYEKRFGVVRNVPPRREEAQFGTAGRPAIPPGAPKIILYQGMLNRGRGLPTAIAALRELPDDYLLWLVGNGDLLEDLRSSNTDLIQQKRLVFHGFVPGGRLPEFTRQAWLGLNLLDAVSPSYYYSLANKCFDYIQAGLPSVQMTFPEYLAIQEQFPCFRFVDRLEPIRLAGNIQQLGEDQAAYRELVAANREAAKVLHWEQEEKTLLKLWAELN